MYKTIEEAESKLKKWRAIAITFMFLFALLSLGLGILYNIGSTAYEQEEICLWDICAGDKYDSYHYDEYNEVCYCFVEDIIEKEHRFK